MTNFSNKWTIEELLVDRIKSETEVNLVLPLINKQILSKLKDIENLKEEVKSMNDILNNTEWEKSCDICSKVEWFMSSIKQLVDGILWHIELKEQKIVILEDEITELKKDKEQLEYKAYKDNLTWLYNRHFMDKVINTNIERSKNSKGYNFCVWLIDLDFFKHVNDEYWHDAWDMVLKKFSDFMDTRIEQIEKATNNDRRRNGKRNVLFRYWGEEFLVVSSLPSKNLKMFLDKCLEWFSKIVHVSEWRKFSVSFSAWISEYKAWDKLINDSFELIGRSDKALYAAKEKWRKTVVIDTEID